jgi:NAD(P)-dependent dehydrogenase (short-subunit alcohol dehydrogenase family)
VSSEPASVLVIGAQGVLGRMCAEALRGAGFDVIRAGRRPESSPDFRLIDLDDPRSVADGCAGVDLVLSTVRHPAHAAERTVAREGGTLLNVASLWAQDREQLKAEAAGARGLVCLHAGLAPGVYSLALKEMLSEHPEADCLQIAGAHSVLQTNGRAAMVDFGYPVLTSARRHSTRMFEFPAPIGRRRCMLVAGPECGFFGELATGRTAHLYFSALERAGQAELLAINVLGLWKRVPLRFFTLGSTWRARRTTSEPHRNILAVTRGEERLAACVVEGSGDYQMTAAATVVFAQALLDRRAADPTLSGVLGAEEIFDLSELRNGFESRGIDIVPLA